MLAVFPLNDLHVQIAQTFREKGIPCDVIWMDIDYMDGFRCFTFDQACYSLDNSVVNIKFFRAKAQGKALMHKPLEFLLSGISLV